MQSDLLDGLNVGSVVALLPQASAPIAVKRLNLSPVFRISGSEYVMMTQLFAAVPVSVLKAPIGSLAEQLDQITAALDMLFHGYGLRRFAPLVSRCVPVEAYLTLRRHRFLDTLLGSRLLLAVGCPRGLLTDAGRLRNPARMLPRSVLENVDRGGGCDGLSASVILP